MSVGTPLYVFQLESHQLRKVSKLFIQLLQFYGNPEEFGDETRGTVGRFNGLGALSAASKQKIGLHVFRGYRKQSMVQAGSKH